MVGAFKAVSDGIDDPENELHLYHLLAINRHVLCHVALYMTITGHTLIFVDLFLSLRNPFYPRQKRWTRYKLILFGVFLGFLVTTIIKVNHTDVGLKLYNYLSN